MVYCSALKYAKYTPGIIGERQKDAKIFDKIAMTSPIKRECHRKYNWLAKERSRRREEEKAIPFATRN